MNWSNWATVASLATAFGTLILAIATFSAVKSANLTAKVAQQSLLVGLRPVLMASRRDDPTQKVNFGDKKWVEFPGGGAAGEVGVKDDPTGPDDPVYLAMGLRNVGQRHRGDARLAVLPPTIPDMSRPARSSKAASRGRWNFFTAITRAGSDVSRGSPCCPAPPEIRMLTRKRNWAGSPRRAGTGTSTGLIPGRGRPIAARAAGVQPFHRESPAHSGDF